MRSARHAALIGLVAALLLVASMAPQAPVVSAASATAFNNRALFEGELQPGSIITDDYSPASGYPAGFGIYDNITMSAFFGEADYFTTGFSNWNIISGDRYCAGCNGSFRLSFQTTSVTVAGVGVYGVGVDITSNDSSLPYWAYVTFGDSTAQEFALPVGVSFFGITSPDLIASVHFGLQGGGSTTSGSFQIDNLTIGAGEGGGGEEGSDLMIEKFVSPDPIIAGQTGTYTIVSTNLGPDPAENVMITEYAVSGVELQNVSCPGGQIELLPDRVVCTWPGTTGVGVSRTMVLTGRACPELTCGSEITNRATTSSDSGGGGGEPVLALYGTMGYGGGATSTLYEMDPDKGGIIREIGPVGYLCNGLDFDPTTGKLYCGTSINDPSFNGLVEVDMTTGAGTPIGAPGWGQGGVPVTNITVNSAGEMYGWSEWCDCLVRVDKATGIATEVGGGIGSWQNGLSFNSIDDLYMVNGDTSFYLIDTGTGNGTYMGNLGAPRSAHHGDFHPFTDLYYGLTWTYGDPRILQQCDLNQQYCVEMTEVGDMHTLAFVLQGEAGGGDPNPGNNSVTLSTEVQTQSKLAISKRDLADPVYAGQQVTYQLDVANAGPSNAESAVVQDTLPEHTTFVSATSTRGFCTGGGNSVTCQLGVLGAPGQCETNYPTSAVITIVAQVSEDTPSSVAPCDNPPLYDQASIRSSNCLPDTGSLNDMEETDVLAGADVEILAPEPVDITMSGVEPDCLAAGDVIRVTQSFSNTGPTAYSRQRDNSGPEFEFTVPSTLAAIGGSCEVISGGGSCNVIPGGAGSGGGRVTWDGSIAVGEGVTLQYRARVLGGQPAGTELVFGGKVNYDDCNEGVNSTSRTAEEVILTLDCPPQVDPNRQLGKEVHLPILNFQGMDDVCRTWIEVQNVGSQYKKAILVTWGEPGFCPPQCAGPLKVECSGLLKPGSTWNFLGAQVPTGSKSGMVFQFSASQLSDVGVDLGFDDVVADIMCETLFFGVVGDCDDYRRFKKAYEEGLEFAGIPMNDRVKGDGMLAIDVLRHCPGDITPGVEVSSKYNGIAGHHLGKFDSVFGGYAYYAPLLYADKAGFNSVLYIQNGGLECSSVEIWFKAQDDCLRARICEIFTLAPGESYQFDATDCVGPDWQGNAWIRSTQPMGVVVDLIGHDVLMTYVAEPAQLNYTYDPQKADYTAGNQVLYGPLVYSEYQGWDTGVQVQNLSSTTAAKVKAYFLDRSGDVVTTLVDWICPRGSQTFFLPVIDSLPGTWVGSIRLESQEWWTPGDPQVLPPYIVGVVTLIKYNDVARGQAQEAIAYNLLPEHKAFDWQMGFGGGGLESGIGLIAIPSLLKDLDTTNVTTELAIANLVPKPGFTDFAIFIYDQNGLLDFVCEKLNEKQVEYIDLQTWGYVNPGFKGSAIISAVFWEHDVFDETGFFLRSLVGLAAVSVERTGGRLGEDLPGDESAGSRGIPFREQDIEDAEFSFGFQGPASPLCPGLPDMRLGPGSCSDMGVYFDGSPGTGAPPGTLGPFTMTPFPPDPQPVIADVNGVDSPLGGRVGFTPMLSHRRIGNGWATWSHGYTGDVYYTNGAATATLTMPEDTAAFYFYVEGNAFALATFEAVHSDGTTSGPIQINGSAGATYFGFYAPCKTLEAITITNTDGLASGFAIGEFGIAIQPNN